MQHRMISFERGKARRDENGKKYIEGYFAVFNKPYKVCSGWIEEIAPGAFARMLANGSNVRVLWNHNRDIVLGCTANATLTLREDEVGLWGSVEINEADSEAVNAHARVERGDVDGASFGFDIGKIEEWWDADGVLHTRILEVDPLYEISPCTFPAYEDTNISARNANAVDAEGCLQKKREQRLQDWKSNLLKKLKGE